jgi:hypothetical protein
MVNGEDHQAPPGRRELDATAVFHLAINASGQAVIICP